MTPNEITTLIASNLKKELDFAFKLQLYERVKYWRATLIKQSLDKVRKDERYFKQTIYLPMERVNILECAAELQCFAARTVDQVPLPLRVNDVGIFSYVGSIDGVSPFGFADSGTRLYLMSGKYARSLTYYDWVNQRILTTQLPELPKVRIEGVFNDPEIAKRYESCDEVCTDCDYWDSEIPMTDDIAQRIVQSILSVDYRPPVTPEPHQVQVNGKSDQQQ